MTLLNSFLHPVSTAVALWQESGENPAVLLPYWLGRFFGFASP
jgi:hypothetical protein